jgi:hypothetical protein
VKVVNGLNVDLEKLISKSQEFVYLLADITAKDI